MAHQAQKDFFNKVKEKYPKYFNNVNVIDCGSLDINGSLKELFENSKYIGVDIVNGKNVDLVKSIHLLDYKEEFDTVVSAEMLEHNEYWKESLQKMYDICKPNGLIVISCAGKGRAEHGTIKTDGNEWGTGDYYMNIESEHIKEIYKDNMFSDIYYEEANTDTYFYGKKI